MNVSCYAEDCSRPAVGQCPGYKGGCGRFYCKQHSLDRLCLECAAPREADRIEKEYTRLAQGLHEEVKSQSIPAVVFWWFCVLVPAIGFFCIDGGEGWGVAWLIVVGLLAFISVSIKQGGQADVLLAEAEKKHKGFGDFYTVWKDNKNREALQKAAAIIAIGTIAVVAGMVGSQEDRIERDVRDIRNRLG